MSGLVLESLRSLLFLDALQQMSKSLWLKQKKCCPSDNSIRTWYIDSKLGLLVGLGISEKPNVFYAVQQMPRSLWLKQKKCCPSDISRRTWHINSKLGFGLVLGSFRSLLFLNPLVNCQGHYNLNKRNDVQAAADSRKRLIFAGHLCLSTHHSCLFVFFYLKRIWKIVS